VSSAGLLPAIHAEYDNPPQLGNFQRSPRVPGVPLASMPQPPYSQRCPLLSVQVIAPWRPPGAFALAGVPRLAYTPGQPTVVAPGITGRVLLPPSQTHSPGTPGMTLAHAWLAQKLAITATSEANANRKMRGVWLPVAFRFATLRFGESSVVARDSFEFKTHFGDSLSQRVVRRG